MRYLCIILTGAMTYWLFRSMNWTGIIVWYFAAVDLLAFCFFARDKMLSMKKGSWRIPEASLLLTCWIGGSFGALLAETFCRHKVSKGSFQWKLYGIVFLQVICFTAFLFLHGDLTPEMFYRIRTFFS